MALLNYYANRHKKFLSKTQNSLQQCQKGILNAGADTDLYHNLLVIDTRS